MPEQRLRIDIADDIIDTLFPDENTGILTLDKTRRKRFDRGIIDIDRLHIDTGNHAIPHAQIGKIQGILKEFDLIIRFMLRLRLPRFEQAGQIGPVENGLHHRNLRLTPHQPQNPLGNPGRQLGDRKKQQIKEIDRRSKQAVIKIRAVPENGFREKFGDEDDDDCRNRRFQNDGPAASDLRPTHCRRERAQQQRHIERIDNQGDIVAHENRREVLSGVGRKDLGYRVEQAALLAVDLQFQAVLARKSDLHPRKKSRKQQHQQNYKHRSYHKERSLLSTGVS